MVILMMQTASPSELRRRPIPTKSQKLAELLQESMGHGRFAVGDRFFSTYQIAQEYGVSTGTARKALVEMVHKGYLESSYRSGHFLRQPPPQAPRPQLSQKTQATTAVMMILGTVDKWGHRIMEQYAAAVEQACQRIGWSLLRVRDDAAEIQQATNGVKVAGCLAYGLHAPPAVNIDPASIILWGGVWRDRACSQLHPNGADASRQAFEHLWDLGHQHTALVRAMPEDEPPTNTRGGILGMRQAFASLSRLWSIDDVFTVWPQQTQGLYRLIRDRGITGVFCQDWEITVELYRQAHQCGEKIGDHLSIVAAGGHDLAEMVHPRPARIYWRFVDYAATAVAAFEQLSQGQRLPHQLVLPVFLEEGPGAKPLLR